jgi:hypothetical protein
MLVPEVRERLLPFARLLDYERTVYQKAGALSVEQVDRLIAEREQKFLAEARQSRGEEDVQSWEGEAAPRRRRLRK